MNRAPLVNAPRVGHSPRSAELMTKHGPNSWSGVDLQQGEARGACPEVYLPIIKYIDTCNFISGLHTKCIVFKVFKK